MKKDNIIQFKKAVEENRNATTRDMFDGIINALDSVIADDIPLVDVMEHLAVITAVMSKDVGIPPATLIVCFAKTVEQIYEEDDVKH